MTMSSAVRSVAFFLCIAFASADAATNVVVVKDLARVLLLPYGDAKLIGLVKKGDQFKVITKKNDWYNVEYKNTIGWIFQDNVRTEVKADVPGKESLPAPAPVQKTSAVPVVPAPPQPPAARQPSAAAMAPEIRKPVEKTEITAEKIEARLKKPVVKQKKQQSCTVDLPAIPVTPSEVEKEKTLPVQEETTAVIPQPRRETPAASVSSPQPPPSQPQAIAKAPDVSNLPSVKPAARQARPQLQAIKDSFSALVQPLEKGEELKKYFQITDNSVKVLASVSPDSPIIGMCKKNDCFVLLFAGQSWCKIRFGNAEGWVERRQGRVVDSPSVANNVPRVILFVSVGCGVFLILVIVVIFLVLSIKSKSARRISIRKDLLIIAHSEKEIQLSLTDSTTSLSKCFSEIGFKVSYASDMDHAKNLLMHYLPDVIVVDWHLGNTVMQGVESVLSNRSSTTNILVIFYNVPDVSTMEQSKVIPNAHFLGISISDREVFKLVTPLIITESKTKSIRRSVESSALGGEIGHGSLIEVMQFIEIGRKTGCLYVTIEKPFGLIYFEQGRLTYAASQVKQGRDAVFEILGLKTGHFNFVLDKVSQTKNVNLSTLEILMEWTKTVDEAHRT
jgi:hypothetical protein